MSGSTTRRSSFALGSVVAIVSSRMRDAAMLRYMAVRWLLLRPRARPALRCIMALQLPVCSGGLVVVLRQPRGRPVLDAHAERQAVALEHFLDLGERLLAEVRRTQQLHLG